MKELVKRWIYKVAPVWTTEYLSARARVHSQKVIASWGCPELNRQLVARLGSKVISGPFSGLALSEMTHAEQICPHLLGLYESELLPAWDIVLANQYQQIIDVGAKFGYYAVGLARRYPKAHVIAFDTDWWARAAVEEMKSVNNTNNVDVKSYCSPDWLLTNCKPNSFIISDCEGFEDQLFTDQVAAKLNDVTLIIETHDGFVPGVSDRLRERFRPTHDIREYGVPSPPRVSPVSLDFLTDRQQELAIKEVRPDQTWLLLTPKG